MPKTLVELKVTTYTPTKYTLHDHETGDVWRGTEDGGWIREGGKPSESGPKPKQVAKPPRSRHPIGKLPYAYKWGDNPACEDSEYRCHDCGTEIFGKDVRFVAFGRNCANGEHSPCPYCGEENYVHRAVKEDEE